MSSPEDRRAAFLTLRVPMRLLRWLTNRAAKEDISRSKLIVRILDQHRQSDEATSRYYTMPHE